MLSQNKTPSGRDCSISGRPSSFCRTFPKYVRTQFSTLPRALIRAKCPICLLVLFAP